MFMAMLDLMPHVIWASVVMYVVHRALALVAAWQAVRTVDPLAPVEVPDDLIALANQERETWAQEETLRAMRERYEALGDWNLVRSAFGVGQRR